jgi:hypothetical protein
MSENGSAELAVLLSQLNAQRSGRTAGVSSPTEAMAMYFVAARLVELQLQLVDRGECDDTELAVTREVLVGTHRMLNAALDSTAVTAPPTRKPTLKMVHGGRSVRRRSRGRYPS